MKNKKYTDLELYMLLRLQAKLVEQTKYVALDKTFKTGVSGGNNVSIFTLLGVLIDLQKLNVFINYPNVGIADKIQINDLVAFIAKNYTNMHHTSKTIEGASGRKTVLNWVVLNTQTFESRFADFIDYLQNDLHISLILPQNNTITTKQKLKAEDSLLAISKIEAKLKKQKEELDLAMCK